MTSGDPTAGTVNVKKPTRLALFFSDKRALIGLVIIAIVTITALVAPFLTPFGPSETDFEAILSPPSFTHPFGTDELGRDVLTRVIFGSRISLSVGLISVGLAFLLGTVLGLIAGYFGGVTDDLVMRIMDVILAFPGILLALAISAALGPSLFNVMLAIGFVNIPRFARLVRGQTLSLREMDYVSAAEALGQRAHLIILRHLLPNSLSPIIVQASIAMGWAILSEASLSFLGVGISPPTPSWGSMLNAGKGYMEIALWTTLFPGIAIFLTVLGFNLMGDGIRDAFDPRAR